jgi:hypothetical protein
MSALTVSLMLGGPHPMRAQELGEVQRRVLVERGRDAFGDGDILVPARAPPRLSRRSTWDNRPVPNSAASASSAPRRPDFARCTPNVTKAPSDRSRAPPPLPEAAGPGLGHERPAPGFAIRSPIPSSVISARRMVPWLTLNSSARTNSFGRRLPTSHSPCFDPADHFGLCGLVERRARHGVGVPILLRNPLRPFARGVN